MASVLTMGTSLRHLRDLFSGGTAVGLTDGQLLARYAADRDGPAFAALVARHGPMVISTCRAVLRHEHDVEDAFQATFLVLARKAPSIRAGDVLGGWLHRVAYRVAIEASVQAKMRRRSELEASAMAIPDATRPGLDPDVSHIVHEEVDRLPDRLRMPVVLCDLEDLTYEQAASRLRWTEPTLRHRLVKARQRLRDRLVRRGVTGAALGVLGTSAEATAAVPSAWAAAAVAAATGGASSMATVALARIIVREMLMTRLKIAATVALTAIGIATAGVVAVGPGRPDKSGTAVNSPIVVPERAEAGVKDAAPREPTPGEMVEVRGRVIDPDGKPVQGARIRSAWTDREDVPAPGTTSAADGRFVTRIRRPSLSSRMRNGTDTMPWIVASAPGFGPGWAGRVLQSTVPGEPTIRLVADGPPIEGRIVDLEGRPVAGARVKVDRLWYAKDERSWYVETGELPAWLARAKDRGIRQGPWDGLSHLPTAIATATTDRDGRFRLAGIGRERIAELLVSGPMIATTLVYAMCHDGPEIRAIDKDSSQPRMIVFRAPRFEQAVAPTQPIQGVIRDKDTGRPIAGVKLRGEVFSENSHLWAEGVEAITDVQGRYRLSGLMKGSAYRLFVEPGAGLPYPKASLRAPAGSPALEPLTFDIALKRGVLVRGRVTDKATGQPVPGIIDAYAFRDNTHVREFPGFEESYPSYVDVENDGRYEVVALPGRGLIACRSEFRRYRTGVGVETIKGHDTYFDTLPRQISSSQCHAFAAIDFDPKIETATVDLQVDPGRSLTMHVVDPEGKPIGGTKASAIGDLPSPLEHEQESTSYEIHILDPSKPGRVTITHADRKLIGSAYLKGDEAGALTVRLQPWGTITGRIVDDEGKPRRGIELHNLRFLGTGRMEPERPDVQGILPGDIRSGGDGRFRIEGLVPALKYGASASDGKRFIGHVFREVTVAPGASKDLGDLKVISPK